VPRAAAGVWAAEPVMAEAALGHGGAPAVRDNAAARTTAVRCASATPAVYRMVAGEPGR